MDYLWRLRVRANYGDTRMFTEGPSTIGRSELVYRDLVYLASSTLLMHELHIAAAIGMTAFLGIADAWLKAHSASGRPLGVGRRRALLAG